MPVLVHLSPNLMGWRPVSELVALAKDNDMSTAWALFACMKQSAYGDGFDDYYVLLGYAGLCGNPYYDYPGGQSEQADLVPVAYYNGVAPMSPETAMDALSHMSNTWKQESDLTYENFVESLIAVTTTL